MPINISVDHVAYLSVMTIYLFVDSICPLRSKTEIAVERSVVPVGRMMRHELPAD
jgi:hypothetical protein